MSTGIIKTSNLTPQNTAITTTYNDNTDGNIMFVSNTSPYYSKIISWVSNNTGLSYTSSAQTGLASNRNAWVGFWSGTGNFSRLNMQFASAFQVNAITLTYTSHDPSEFYTQFYGSNSSSVLSDT